jgi:hypothetical protein
MANIEPCLPASTTFYAATRNLMSPEAIDPACPGEFSRRFKNVRQPFGDPHELARSGSALKTCATSCLAVAALRYGQA